jgi:peptidyl-prolyl cis-trans isomerase C
MRVLFLALTLALSLPALAQEDPVVAQVGEEVIGKSQFDLRFRLFAKSALRQLGLPESEESLKLLEPYKAPYLEALAEEQALLRVARAQGFWPHPDRVEAQIEQMKGAFSSEEAFLSALQGAGVPDLATYRLLLSEAMALEALEGHYRERLTLSPAALKILWLLSPEYRHGALYCARHILVPTLEEAKAVLARLSAGEPFAKVAQEVSQDPGSREAGGELGCEPEGTYIPAFEKALDLRGLHLHR